MAIRVSTRSNYTRFLSGLRTNQSTLIRAQEQIASGRRVLRPSDDPTGTARILSAERQLADLGRFRESATSGQTILQTASTTLQDASTLLSEARSLLLQGMNGTLADADREGIAREIGLLRSQMIDLANAKQGDRYLFGGNETNTEPFQSVVVNGRERVMYFGDDGQQEVEISQGSFLPINVPGSQIFDRFQPTGLSLVGSTGVSLGSTADEGRGYEELTFRHDTTDLGIAAAQGVALVNGGDNDSFLGPEELTIDLANGTIRLGTGETVPIPDPGDRDDVVVQNEEGGILHLDLSGWSGVGFSGGVTGRGSVSLGTNAFVPLNFAETDFAVRDEENGTTIHLNLTTIGREGSELATFSGTANIFDVLGGIEQDLLNADRSTSSDRFDRLSSRLADFDRNRESLLSGLGVLGARAKRAEFSDERASGMQLQLETMVSRTRDADFAEVALDLALAETTLQTAQASGARLIQNSLLNFLR